MLSRSSANSVMLSFSHRYLSPASGIVLLMCLLISQRVFFPSFASAQQAGHSPAGRQSTPALLGQAKKLVQQNDPQGALSLLQQADTHGVYAADVHTLKGICLALLSKPIESAAEFDQAIALRPNYAPSYLSSGLAYASFDNLDRALERLSMAVNLGPTLPGARYNYALVLARVKSAQSRRSR